MGGRQGEAATAEWGEGGNAGAARVSSIYMRCDIGLQSGGPQFHVGLLCRGGGPGPVRPSGWAGPARGTIPFVSCRSRAGRFWAVPPPGGAVAKKWSCDVAFFEATCVGFGGQQKRHISAGIRNARVFSGQWRRPIFLCYLAAPKKLYYALADAYMHRIRASTCPRLLARAQRESGFGGAADGDDAGRKGRAHLSNCCHRPYVPFSARRRNSFVTPRPVQEFASRSIGNACRRVWSMNWSMKRVCSRRICVHH
jgi:hypothetical protein